MRMRCVGGHMWGSKGTFENGAVFMECSWCHEVMIIEAGETVENTLLDVMDEAWEDAPEFGDEHDPDVQRDLARDRDWEDTHGPL